MNKHLYRIVFNKARGIMMAVAENVSAYGKGDAASSAVIRPMVEQIDLRLKSISFAAKLTTGVMTVIMPFAHAQIVADPTAPNNQRPTIVQTANGLPQVNIQTPSAAGVSRNTYSQFDVQSNGAILNNSRDNVLTQTGGWVQGNPWLSGGAARVILNEVNSSNPSHLRGYVEVAGQKAEVIIANPAGIQINGGGFINADRVTLTTGTATSNPVNNGSLESYRITQGTISVEGLGLDTRGATYTDILARSVQVNAGIWANKLKVVTGANDVSVNGTDYPGNVAQGITPIAGAGPTPQFSLDVAALGGMYAGHIYLVGSESGMGVRNQGAINANGGNLVLLSNGFLTNEGAILAASSNGNGGKLHIETAGNITNSGAQAVIRAQDQADLVTTGELFNTVDARIDANNNLAITADTLSNAGKLGATDKLIVNATNIDNAATGEMAANTANLTAANKLSNRGLIDGTETVLRVDQLDNIGTGRIYGDQLAIAANTLNNDSETLTGLRSDAVIAARQRMDLGVGTLNNRDGSLLFSAGTEETALNIGRSLDAQAHATGTADVVTNQAATIESMGGLTITAGKINNLNPDFSTRTDTTSESTYIHYIRLGGTRYLESALGRCFKCASDRFDDGDPSLPRLEYVAPSSAYPFEAGFSRVPYQLNTYEYYETEVGGMTVQVPYLYPADSPVWALFGVAVGDQVTLRSYLQSYNQSIISRAYRDFYQIWVTSTQTVQTVVDNPGTPGRIISAGGMKLAGAAVLNDNSQIMAGGNLDISGASLTNTETMGQKVVTDFGSFRGDSVKYKGYGIHAGYFGSGAYAEVTESVTTKLDTSVAKGNTSVSGTGTQVAGPRTPPSSSLLILNPDPYDSHIYKGDPRFNNQQQWLSSDYMLQELATDPNTIKKRLGDGFYEQMLIREQVAELTGRRFLDGYASDEAQYQALMQAGAAYAKQWELVPGVSLTPAQMAALTSDIVWLVAQEVVLPDGTTTTALVPQVYVVPRPGDLSTGGSLLAGQNVNIQLSGDLKNSGTIAGRNVMQINADNVQNFGDIVGKTVNVAAQEDLLNIGGSIVANDSLTASAGRDFVIESTTSTGTASSGRSSSSLTQIDRVAGLYVTGDKGILVASAGNDFSVLAGVLASSGDIQVSTGNNMNLGTVETAYKSDLTANDRNYMRASGTQDVGSQIVSVGKTTLTAGNNFDAKAATVNAIGDLSVNAAGDIQIAEGRATSQSDDARYAKSKGFLSSSSTESREQSSSNTAIGSYFGGDNVTITSGGSAVIRGSTIIGDADTKIAADKDLIIEAAISSSQSSTFSDSRKGSLISSKENKKTTETYNTQVVGSSVAGNNVTLSAGSDIAVIGSQVDAVKDVIVSAGQDVLIAAAIEDHNTAQTSETKRSGFSGSFQTGLSVGSSKSNQTLDQQGQLAITSSISGNNVKINADRDVDVLGSAVLADKDINIAAGRNINIDVVKETQSTTSTSQSSSTRIGLHPSLSGSMTILGINSEKQNGQADGQSSVTSLLSANSGNLTMVAGNAGTRDATITTRGADLLAGNAITLEADRIDLLAARDTSSSSNQAESKSFTVGSKPAGQIGGLINSAIESAMAASQGSGNDRLDNALALKAGYDTYKAIEKSAALANGFKDLAQGADPGGAAFGVSISVGSSKSSSSSSSASTEVTGTNLQAKSIDLNARQTDITMEGAKLQAETINLEAKRDVILVAAANTSEVHSVNKSSSASVGITVGIGQQSGISLQLGVQNAKGKANGEETTYDNTLITATDKLTIKSGNDTTLQGAQLAAQQVKMEVGGDLTIQTLQDQSKYESEQKSSGFGLSLCIPPFCVGASSVSVNTSNQSIKHNYQSAQGQSGISVGDGGFDITVANATDLVGAAITSTADKTKNNLSTGSLSSSDLNNVQDTATKSSSFSGTAALGPGATISENLTKLGNDSALNLLGNAAANKALPKDGHEQSQTLSVISPANITITGSNAEQNAQSQQTAEELTSRDASIANGALTNTLTLQQAAELEKKLQQARLEDQAARMMGELGQKMAEDIGTYANNKVLALMSDAEKALDSGNVALANELNAEAEKWNEGGIYRVGLHTVVGGVSGGAGGALGAGFSAELIPEIAKSIDALDIPVDAKQALITLAGAAVGSTVGGAAGAATGLNQTVNNYLNHVRPKMLQLSEKELYDNAAAACSSGNNSDACNKRNELALLSAQRDAIFQAVCGSGPSTDCNQLISQAKAMGNIVGGKYGSVVYANSPDVSLGLNMQPIGPSDLNKAYANAFQYQQALSLQDGLYLAGSGYVGGKLAASTLDMWNAYRAASAAYSSGAALGTGVTVGGVSYTASAAFNALYDERFGSGQPFGVGFDQRFSYGGLGTSAAIGGLTGLYGTAMFGWAGVPNSITNVMTLPGAIIRINSALLGKTAGEAMHSILKSSNNR
ncbi:hemagglutinin repeat-containing protein [Herminiimonas contaminans]|uniref:Hemagglutinin repeat-containing protein n=1 Tax=Herminiimonas contaminans TaxID=1111140 RepID=A0ABS0ENV2_9BURK|nr:hemagglutinin repeat-containing protein [Herminiimonas contaminans]MBF8176528.1 hemagglutinin repeat-containing protein [Herminiimonas contaminans]